MLNLINSLTVPRGDSRYLLHTRPVVCLSSDEVGDFVHISGDRVDDKYTVTKADPEDEAKMPAVGVLLEKISDTEARMQLLGPCLLFSGLDITKPAYVLGSSGIQTGLPSVGGNGYVMVQQLGIPVASDRLLLTGNIRMTKRRAELG